MTNEPPAFAARPIVVLGFGRSGTTWISDILSKTLGGLILFEPLHPEVCPFAADACYADGRDAALSARLEAYLQAVLAAQERNRWLLRNHLFSPLEDVSSDFVNTVWDQCNAIGFKEIRANFLTPWLIEHFHARPVYVARHPCAVIASLRRRPNFWNEFGWDTHERLFSERVLDNPAFADQITLAQRRIVAAARGEVAKQATMWALSHTLTVAALRQHDLPVFLYEDFYQNPFAATRALLRYLGHDAAAIHPSHIFVPSMTTLRTVHGLTASESDYQAQGMALFWADVLSPSEAEMIMEIVSALGVTDYAESRPEMAAS